MTIGDYVFDICVFIFVAENTHSCKVAVKMLPILSVNGNVQIRNIKKIKTRMHKETETNQTSVVRID